MGGVEAVANQSDPLSCLKGAFATQLQLIVVLQKSRLVWPNTDIYIFFFLKEMLEIWMFKIGNIPVLKRGQQIHANRIQAKQKTSAGFEFAQSCR